MTGTSHTQRKAQLDKPEREHLEDIISEMRERVEDNVRFQLTQSNLDTCPSDGELLDQETQQLVDAIELEAADGEDWDEAFEQYVDGVGYTIVNRLAALRCMEVRDFIDEEVTVFKEDGLTPAAETLVHEEFLLEDEAILEAYHNTCDELAAEIEILFDRSSAYSLVDPDDDTFEELCGMLNQVPDEVWRADDVLGWVYEYYNVKLLDDLRRKGDREGLEPEDVPPANQFYTPHWVVRMLTDNSLGKLYLENTGELQNVVDAQQSLSPDERKNRPLSPDKSPDIAEFCTYLVPSEEAEGEPTEFDDPTELRVIDPACGSGHFLLYAFDVLERIWRAERPDLDPSAIPRQILEHNLYGVDLDMRACQLSAFNLYLKGRTRAEAEGADSFEMPEVGIVCADAKIANVEGVEKVFAEVADGRQNIESALSNVLDAFEEIHGLGSLLDVRGTLGEMFNNDTGTQQLALTDNFAVDHSLSSFLSTLQEAIAEHRNSSSFLAQDLRSFIRLLDVLALEYDVALMNPPYGSQNRMPDTVKSYVEKHYKYKPEFYINFFEVCNRLSKENGRIGMLVPRTFMFKTSFEDFRQDFIGKRGSFEFLSEFGMGVLDNATVRTAGTVVRSGEYDSDKVGVFFRLHDLKSGKKESKFIETLCGVNKDENLSRLYRRSVSEFSLIPGSPISYWVPKKVRSLYESEILLENRTDSNQESLGVARAGLQTSDDNRFLRRFWEVDDFDHWKPYAKGGEDAWSLPRITYVTYWGNNGEEVKRYPPSIVPNEEYYFTEVLAFTYIKEGGKRFGYLHPSSIFGHSGFVYIPDSDIWNVLSYVNSNIFTYLMIAQTTGRHWNVGEISKIPWAPKLRDIPELETLSKRAAAALLQLREHDFNSPYYTGPLLLKIFDEQLEEPLFAHPHQDLRQTLPAHEIEHNEVRDFDGLLNEAVRHRQSIKSTLDRVVIETDEIVFDEFGIGNSVENEIIEEVQIRTSESPKEAPLEAIDPDQYTTELIEDVLIHAALQVVRDSKHGIVPLHSSEGSLYELVIRYLHNRFDGYSEEFLPLIDSRLGQQSPDKKEFPNISKWLNEDLFSAIIDRYENVPPVWLVTTSRLLSDSKGVGFKCLIDYHQIDSSIFDKLSSQYIEPRKVNLRERRSAADRRRNNDSLTTTEKAEAVDAYENYTDSLDQIAAFEDTLQDLSDSNERDFGVEERETAKKLATKVKKFRQETQDRLQTLDELRESKTTEWFEDTFSPKFWETVKKWRSEWIEALHDLEKSCTAYSGPVDQPIESHLADRFGYFNDRLKGSDHYSSSGILFMTYYFEREGTPFLDENGEPKDGLKDEYAKQLAKLGAGLDEYKALAEEISDNCNTLSKAVPSDWEDRALSEITTTGYDPNRKHGVKINITPLAEAEIVPKTVDDKVL